MGLREELEMSGEWLFRWRSFVPLALFSPLFWLGWQESKGEVTVAWEAICCAVSLLGLAVRCVVVGYAPPRTSTRSTKHFVAHSLSTQGVYSIVRHPLYVGNFLMWLGMALLLLEGPLLLVFCLIYWLYYERIMLVEEAFLRTKFGSQFELWSSRTPALIPLFSQWERPTQPFCCRTVRRKEYTGFFALLAAFFALHLLTNEFDHRSLQVTTGHFMLLSLGAALYLSVIILKKRTTWLKSKSQVS